jgi:hypothetical protein
MNPILKKAQGSPDAALQFLVDTQFDGLLERAIAAKVVNASTDKEGLFNIIKGIAESGDKDTFEYIMSAPLTMEGASPEAQEALQYIIDQQPKMQRSVQPGSGANWTPENTSTAMIAFSSLVGSFLSFFNDDATAPPAGGGNGTTPAPAPSGGEQPSGFAKYMPWVLGGVGVLFVAVILVLVLRKK